MFIIKFFVDDKNLGEAFKRLAGIAMNVEHQYVPNVEKTKPNGSRASPQLKGVDAMELFSKELHKRGKNDITGPEFREMIDKLGLRSASYSYFIQKLVGAGVLKKGKITGNVMHYTLTGK